jgi:hypothetical protein
MRMKASQSREDLLRAYDRGMLRSAFVSLFWNILGLKKITQKMLADRIGVNKSEPTRWFTGARPNWTIDTIADIASALDVDIEVRAHDRMTGAIFTVSGQAAPEPRWYQILPIAIAPDSGQKVRNIDLGARAA